TRAFARIARVLSGELDRSLAAGGHLLERQLDLGLQRIAALSARPARAAAPAEAAPEDVLEHREDVARVHVGEVVTRAPAEPGVAELVVPLPGLRVGEHLVSLGAFLELDLRFRVPAVAVGVILHGQLAIRALDLLAGRGAVDGED